MDAAPGYHVVVKFAATRSNFDKRREGGVASARHFNFGEWQEIGFWLDEQGLNGEDYAVSITFVEEQTIDHPCADCGLPVHWDEAIGEYQHDDPDAPDCFLVTQKEAR